MNEVENVTAFVSLIRSLSGVTEDDLDRAVRDCLQAINDFGGKASITLKFEFRRHKNFDDVVGVKAYEPVLKLPKEEQTETMLFTNVHNDLLMHRQEQTKLLLEETHQPSRPLKEVK